MTPAEAWEKVRELACSGLPPSTRALWIDPLEAVGFEADGAIVLRGPSPSVSWVQLRYAARLKAAAEEIGIPGLVLEVDGG